VGEISWATPLYEFLRQCNESPLPREVLDCGAGGSRPPLSMFYEQGYRTAGVEIAEEALAEAIGFCREHSMALSIIRADMRQLPFASESFSFVYSYNAIFFMTKPDIALSMDEITRVLRPGGLCYVNFRSVDDPDKRVFSDNAFARRLLGSEHFSDFEDDEADAYFRDYEILLKEKRLIDKASGEQRLKQVFIQYIVKKNSMI
jgi:SAM-dependent methyltransferase